MAIKRMPIGQFVAQLEAALNRKDGYIMAATGQDPKKQSVNRWWFTQYSGSQKTKALYWREHAARVQDYNGLAEGLYKDFAGVSINTRARNNYAEWCGVKGKGMIPADKRQPGASVGRYTDCIAGAWNGAGHSGQPAGHGNTDSVDDNW